MEPTLWLLAGIALLAFTLKATTGFGPSIVFIALGSLLIEPKTLVPASSLLDLLAGGLLLRVDTEGRTLRYWLPLGVSISVGAIVGALFLDAVPAETFRRVLGWFVLGLGVWFVLGIGGGGREEHLPAKASRLDHAMTLLGGVFGGLAGISGPPIIWQFGRQYAKRAFRQVLVPIFFAAAVVRTIAYAGTGLVDSQTFLLAGVAVPGLLAGLYLGNRLHVNLSETVFRRVVGVVLIVVALRMNL